MLQRLRKTFLFATIIPILIFALAFLAKNMPYVSDEVAASIMSVYFIVVLVVVPLSSYWLRRTTNKAADVEEEEGERMVSKAYTIRIWTLSVCSILAGILYVITCQMNCVYLFAMLAVLMLFSYPSEKFIYHE
ncbi:MAG: hypothetical protein MJZ18_10555 [Bacteroidales bacterium]|nr:hypothetical protein [Bacteroidales bacterium]